MAQGQGPSPLSTLPANCSLCQGDCILRAPQKGQTSHSESKYADLASLLPILTLPKGCLLGPGLPEHPKCFLGRVRRTRAGDCAKVLVSSGPLRPPNCLVLTSLLPLALTGVAQPSRALDRESSLSQARSRFQVR